MVPWPSTLRMVGRGCNDLGGALGAGDERDADAAAVLNADAAADTMSSSASNAALSRSPKNLKTTRSSSDVGWAGGLAAAATRSAAVGQDEVRG